MAVTTKNQPPATRQTQEAPETPPDVHLELVRVKRFVYQGTLYEAGKVYVFDAASSRVVLGLKDPQGLPVFTRAKARTKLVEVAVDVNTIATKPVQSIAEGSFAPSGVAPRAQLDLGDDDPELAARLEALDANGEAPEFLGGEIRVVV